MFTFARSLLRDGAAEIDEESFPALEKCLDGGWHINPATQFSIQFGQGSPSDLQRLLLQLVPQALYFGPSFIYQYSYRFLIPVLPITGALPVIRFER